MKQTIIQLLTAVLQQLNLPVDHLALSRPENPEHGTYTTNIAFILGKQTKQNPIELANKIIATCRTKTEADRIFQTITVAGPGFINITVKPEALIQQLAQEQAVQEIHKRLVIEYTQPNPFKEMHIGHLYSNAVGESLSRLYEETGWRVRRVNYQGDIGLHVGKALWGLIQIRNSKSEHQNSTQLFLEELSTLNLKERINILGKAYAIGTTAYEEDKQLQNEIKQINIMAHIAAQRMHKEESKWEPIIDYSKVTTDAKNLQITQEDIYLLYTQCRRWNLDYFEERYRYLGTTFDGYYFESRIAEIGYALVKENVKNGIFEEDQGAIVYRGEKDGLHTRVFINSLGLPVYEAKDLGLAPTKYQDWPYDLSIVETAKEINEYFKVIITVLKKINPDIGEKTLHVSHGMVKLPEGKMSSRTGNVKTTDWLIGEVEQAVRNVMSQSKISYAEAELEEIVHVLTVATIKFSLLRVSLPSDIAFDIEKSVSLEGDSGPYLVYTYARCKSVLRKMPASKLEIQNTNQCNPEETNVLRQLVYFEEHTQEAKDHHSPSSMCRYLIDLAQLFNTLYAKHQIIDSGIRLLLTEKTAATIKKGLYLLGIQTVERM